MSLLMTKLTLEVCQLTWRVNTKSAANNYLAIFFFKKNYLYKKKIKNDIRFIVVKIKVLTQFTLLKLKLISEMRQKMTNLALRAALNKYKMLQQLM